MIRLLLPFFVVCLSAPAIAWAQASQSSADDRAAVTAGDNAFAIDLYAHLRRQPGNLFFSPESISTALAMSYAGARGQTAAEMAKTLHFTLPPDHLHPAMGALLADLSATHPGYQLRAANALWAQQGYAFLSDFLHITRSDYGAGFHQVDFKDGSDSARQTINQWVAQKTEEKIKDLIGPGVLNRQTRLVLTNAIYFKGDWEEQFDRSLTKAEDFRVSPAQSVNAPMMHRDGAFNYFDGGTFQALEIPYTSRELSMIVLLPKDPAGLTTLEQSLTAAGAKPWLSQLRPAPKVILTFPRFKITQQFSLAGTLASMGMSSAFNAHADFSGINPSRELYLSAVIHKAFVDVNEEGTEAAAATAIIGLRATVARRPQPPIVFRADHPFVFLIRENKSGAILFLGRVVDPTK